MPKSEKSFAKSSLADIVRQISDKPHRPSDILGIVGSPLERLLWDIAVLQGKSKDKVQTKARQVLTGKEAEKLARSMNFSTVKERLEYKRRLQGIV